MVLVNSGFHTQKNFSENVPQFGYAPLKILSAFSVAENLEEI